MSRPPDVEVIAIHSKRLQRFEHQRGRRSWPAVEQRDFTEEIAGSHGFENDAVTRIVLEEDFDDARADDIH